MRGVTKVRYGWGSDYLRIEFRHQEWARTLINDDYQIFMRSTYALIKINTSFQRDTDGEYCRDESGERVRIPHPGSDYEAALTLLRTTHNLVSALPVAEYHDRRPMRQRSVQRMAAASRRNATARREAREQFAAILGGTVTVARVPSELMSRYTPSRGDADMVEFLAAGQ